MNYTNLCNHNNQLNTHYTTTLIEYELNTIITIHLITILQHQPE